MMNCISIHRSADKSLAFPISPNFILITIVYHINVYCFLYAWLKFHNCSLIIYNLLQI
jgi:hypothetical protein